MTDRSPFYAEAQTFKAAASAYRRALRVLATEASTLLQWRHALEVRDAFEAGLRDGTYNVARMASLAVWAVTPDDPADEDATCTSCGEDGTRQRQDGSWRCDACAPKDHSDECDCWRCHADLEVDELQAWREWQEDQVDQFD